MHHLALPVLSGVTLSFNMSQHPFTKDLRLARQTGRGVFRAFISWKPSSSPKGGDGTFLNRWGQLAFPDVGLTPPACKGALSIGPTR